MIIWLAAWERDIPQTHDFQESSEISAGVLPKWYSIPGHKKIKTSQMIPYELPKSGPNNYEGY